MLGVLAQSTGLKFGFLWFQCFKSDGHELQKSNASLQARPPRKLQSNRKLCSALVSKDRGRAMNFPD